MAKKATKKVVKKVEPTYINGFQYVGNGDSDPAYIGLYGYLFTLNGRVIEVDDKTARKLKTNNHFKEV
jgi:hypothetical protein